MKTKATPLNPEASPADELEKAKKAFEADRIARQATAQQAIAEALQASRCVLIPVIRHLPDGRTDAQVEVFPM